MTINLLNINPATTDDEERQVYEEAAGVFMPERSVDPTNVFEEQLPLTTSPDAHMDRGKMEFDPEVAREFEKTVIPRQVPGYDQMRNRILNTAAMFLRKSIGSHGTATMIDLGCSTAQTIREIGAALLVDPTDRDMMIDKYANRFYAIGIDKAEGMFEQATQKILADTRKWTPPLATDWAQQHITLANCDLSEASPLSKLLNHMPTTWDGANDGSGRLALITSVLTIQFIPPECRPELYRDIYRNLQRGGALLLVEKFLGRSLEEETLWTELYYEVKRQNGMSKEDILAKRRAIERQLIPMTPEGQYALLEGAGFERRNIIPVWKDCAFEFLVAIK